MLPFCSGTLFLTACIQWPLRANDLYFLKLTLTTPEPVTLVRPYEQITFSKPIFKAGSNP